MTDILGDFFKSYFGTAKAASQIDQWNELNPNYKIRSLANGCMYSLDLPNGKAEQFWEANEAIDRALELKVKDRPSLKELSQKATAQIIHINEVRRNA